MVGQKGQTVVEYVLFLVVILTVFSAVYSIVREKVLGDKGSCTASSTSLICKFEKLYSLGSPGTGSGYQRFRYFRILQ